MDTNIYIAIAALLVGAGLGGTVAYLHLTLLSLQRQIHEMRQTKRHTYSTSAGLEDAIAVLLDIQFRRDAESARLQQAMSILRQVRGGPRAYDPDRPAGRRPEGFEQ